jgi:hypothetical protein
MLVVRRSSHKRKAKESPPADAAKIDEYIKTVSPATKLVQVRAYFIVQCL